MKQVVRISGFTLFGCLFLPLLPGRSQHSPVIPYHLLLWDFELFDSSRYCWPYFFGLIAGLGTFGTHRSEQNSALLWRVYAFALTVVSLTLWLAGGHNLTHFGSGRGADWFRDSWNLWPLLPLAATLRCPTWNCAYLLVQWGLSLSASVWFLYLSDFAISNLELGGLLAEIASVCLLAGTSWDWIHACRKSPVSAQTTP